MHLLVIKYTVSGKKRLRVAIEAANTEAFFSGHGVFVTLLIQGVPEKITTLRFA